MWYILHTSRRTINFTINGLAFLFLVHTCTWQILDRPWVYMATFGCTWQDLGANNLSIIYSTLKKIWSSLATAGTLFTEKMLTLHTEVSTHSQRHFLATLAQRTISDLPYARRCLLRWILFSPFELKHTWAGYNKCVTNHILVLTIPSTTARQQC